MTNAVIRFFLPIFATAIFLTSLGIAKVAQSRTITVSDLNRIAEHHKNSPVSLGEFNIFFHAETVRFERDDRILRILIHGVYADSRKAVRTGKTADETNIQLDLNYQIDIRNLDPNSGITTADTHELIEIDCVENLVCVRLEISRNGQITPPPTGLTAGVIAGLGPSDLKDGNSGQLISALTKMANQMRQSLGLVPIQN